MTGPPYPPSHSNAIGFFEIGVSPIGTVPAFDYWQTIISQYANSPTLTAIIGNIFDCLDPTLNIDNFFSDVMDIDTAVGHGLDVWGRILDVSRVLTLIASKNLGFEEQGGITVDPFNQSPFYSGSPSTGNYSLADDAYRVLLLAKAAANITDGSMKSFNAILLSLFPHRGNCYVTDGGESPAGNMTMTYTFAFSLTPVEVAIVTQSGVLPRPAGVSATVISP